MRNKFFPCLTTAILLLFNIQSYARTIIAIDAGHGGKDPGAISKNLGIKEKDVTLSIARELKALLDADPNFKTIMTRNSDKFIQLPKRTEIARKSQSNYLVSIHADSSPNSSDMKGASVWVLSNRRANDELGKWMEDHEKQSELLGGAGSVLSTTNERYLSQTVLDLQFSHSQRSGYELGKTVLHQLNNITALAKSTPQHASLSVLRSPDIPSILIETGFLSNSIEEKKLSNVAYHRQLARAIYNGLVEYCSRYSGYVVPKTIFRESTTKKADLSTNDKSASINKNTKVDNVTEKTKKQIERSTNTKAPVTNDTKVKKDILVKESSNKENNKKEPAKPLNPNATQHIVGQDETLYSIARMYKTTPEKLSQLNGIKDNKIVVGKKLKIK